MRTDEMAQRLDRLEHGLRALQAELEAVRELAAAAPAVEQEAAREPAPAPVPSPRPEGTTLDRAWHALERGQPKAALALASEALEQALAEGDEESLNELVAFAAAAQQVLPPSLEGHARELASRATGVEEPVAATEPAQPPRAPVRGPSAADRIAAFARAELAGARAFALVGGVVTLLGVVFLFVLAANRGWIGPVARVSSGGAASVGVLLAGVGLRVRFGRTQASLAAVGAGVAGSYATLAASTIVYDFLPGWGALLVAATIASTGAGVALRWDSQLLAGLSLIGAAVAPALLALDDEIGAPGTGFAVVVLGAAFAAGTPRRWTWLVLAVGSVALAQVAWLTAVSPAADRGALSVAVAAALVLLGGGIGRQAAATGDGLDPLAGTLSLAGGGLALGTLSALLPVDRDAGWALAAGAAVYAAAALAARRRWPDLAWAQAAVALLLAGVATADLFSQRSLTVAWAVEAAVLAALAWRLLEPRFEGASLLFLSLAAVHAVAFDAVAEAPAGDLPRSAAPGLFAVAAAAVVAGTAALERRRAGRAAGLLARLEPLWDALVAGRGSVRMLLWSAAVGFAAAGSTTLLSGRWLTIAWAGSAAALAVLAFALGERRLQGAGLAFFVLALLHAFVTEAPPSTLALARDIDALAPVPSLFALAAAAAALAALSHFPDRGIALLGPLAGGERALGELARHALGFRGTLAVASAWLGIWAAGLVLVDAAREPGQAAATGLWSAAAVAASALAARRRSAVLVLAAAPALLALGKATAFDWDELGSGAAGAALLLAAGGLLLVGLLVRYALADDAAPVESVSLVTASIWVVAALVAVERLTPGRPVVLGAAGIGIAAAVAALAIPPYRGWRSRRTEPWLRSLATVHWAVALTALGVAEAIIVDGRAAATVTLWAVSAALVAALARPLVEPRLALAGLAGAAVAAVTCVSTVTVPAELFVASADPGSGLWALAACVAALGWTAAAAPAAAARLRPWVGGAAALLALFGLSLGVLELAERISRASVETDFQRGHTAVSALWGALALGLFVAGLVRAERALQRVGLTLFGLALAKLFLYDLRSLSSVARAVSFLAVGAILLAAAFFVERIVRGEDESTAAPRPVE